MPSPSEVGTFSSSSLGPGGTTFGPSDFRATNVLSSPRFKELDRRQAYYDCTQHDEKRYDFDGRIISLHGPGALASQPLINNTVAPFYVPLRMRRPSAPYRLARVMTNSFTNLVFGAGRFPDVKVIGDANSQDFQQALADDVGFFQSARGQQDFAHARPPGCKAETLKVEPRTWNIEFSFRWAGFIVR